MIKVNILWIMKWNIVPVIVTYLEAKVFKQKQTKFKQLVGIQ